MADFKNNRRMALRIYFADSPNPIDISNVCHIGTEGGLLRIVTESETQWWPLCQVFNIRMMGRSDNG